MSDALAIAASGLKSEEYFIGKIANDLANIHTPSYKAGRIIFADLLYQNITETNPLMSNQTSTSLGLGTSIYQTTKDFSSGPLKPSNNWKDVAIDGGGFFQVVHHDGNIAFTRNSSLTIDEDRYLATQEGLRLADNIQIPEEYTEITIQKNGDVLAILDDRAEPELLGTIKLAKFLNPETLTSLGAGIYKPSLQTSEAIIDTPGTNGLGLLMQKQIEESNVDMVNTLMQLTMAQRVYQLNAKAIQIVDEMEKITNEIPN